MPNLRTHCLLAVVTLCGSMAFVSRPIERQAFISVVDKRDVPVTNLTTSDLIVREGGKSRRVLRVEPATGALDIELLIDTSANPLHLRAAVRDFAATIWKGNPDARIALHTIGPLGALEADLTSRTANFERLIDALFDAPAPRGGYFIDTVVESANTLARRASGRPVIVGYIDDQGPELSRHGAERAFDALAAARASLWTVAAARYYFPLDTDTQEYRERASLLGNVTVRTGGRRVTVGNSMSPAAGLTAIATRLLSQLLVTYGSDDTLALPVKLEIGSTNDDLRVTAPQRTTR